MVVMICPSGSQFFLTSEELERLVGEKVDGVYTFVNGILRRQVTVRPDKPLTRRQWEWVTGRDK